MIDNITLDNLHIGCKASNKAGSHRHDWRRV